MTGSVAAAVPSPRRNFALLWLAQALSVTGSAFSFVAMPILVLRATGSVAHMGWLTAAGSIGTIGAGAFAGHLVDRYDHRRILVTCDAARAAVFATVLVDRQVGVLYAVMLIGSALGMVSQVCYTSVVAGVVPTGQLAAANGKFDATYAVAYIVGPVSGASLSAVTGPAGAVGANALMFALSCGSLTLLRLPAATRTPPAPGDRLAGLAFLWRHPALRALTVIASVISLCTLGLTDVFIYYVRHDLGQSDTAVGYLVGAAALGAVASATAAPRLRQRLSFGTCWVGAYVLCGTAALSLALRHTLAQAVVAATLFSFGTTLANTCSRTYRQTVTPPAVLGRVTSAFWTVQSALAPVGAVALTTSTSAYGVPAVTGTVGTICLAAAAGSLLTPITRSTKRTAP
ncbi:MFS transporter [Kitasatospora aureofaciens]|uniref:MFS transporter n=1 Tax=Kitasatospora aureofaciens TaxID=1894 RepID=UPI001C43E671|nr:MFS transporter [Kitasatospora aureofaciens]MBV6702746.1 MFS transporter [Kitasatospora aureofaciens]